MAADAFIQTVWKGWLEHRIPHWDAMEHAAAQTLDGSRWVSVRVSWNHRDLVPDEWHATLFTLVHETCNPAKTFASAAQFKPADFVLHHEISDEPHPAALAPPDPRPAALTAALTEAMQLRRVLLTAERDPRAPAAAVERARARSQAAARSVLARVDQAIVDGLHARANFPLVPPMVVKREMLVDWHRYRVVLAIRRSLMIAAGNRGPWHPQGVSVCQACTLVFVPRRRSTAAYCDLCAKRPAESLVIGQRAIERGVAQTVRVPKLTGRVIRGWQTATITICAYCDKPFSSRRDATACPECSNRARQRRHRRARADA